MPTKVQVTANGVIRWGNRVVVRSSGGTPYVVVENGGNIQVFKGNGVVPTSFSEQDAGGAPDATGNIEVCCAIDSADILHVAWYFNDPAAMGATPGIRYGTFNTVDAAASQDTWALIDEEAAALINSLGDFGVRERLCIAIDANDDPHLCYYDIIASMGSNLRECFYVNKIGGTWNTKVSVEQMTVEGDVFTQLNMIIAQPTSAIGADRPIIVTVDNRASVPDIAADAFHGNALNATSFVVTRDIVLTTISGAGDVTQSLAVDSNGDISYAYADNGRDPNVIQHLASNNWATWETPVELQAMTCEAVAITINGTKRFVYVIHSLAVNDLDLWIDSGSGFVEEGDPFETTDGAFVKSKWSKYANNNPEDIDFVWQEGATIQWNTFSDAGAITRQKAFFLDGILQAIDQTKTFLLNAILLTTQQKTFLLDARLVNRRTKAFLLNAILQKVQQKTFSLDGILAKLGQTKTFLLDARLINRRIKTFLLDAILIPTPEKIFDIDAILQKVQQKTFLLDTRLIVVKTKAFLLDGILQQVQQKTFQLDAILKKVQQKTFLLDAKLINRRTKDFFLDAVLTLRFQKTFALDAVLKALAQTRTFTMDAFLIITPTQRTFLLDALLSLTRQKTFTLGARLINRRIRTFSLDARLVNRFQRTFGLDAILKATQQKIFLLDGALSFARTKTFLLDARLINRRIKTFAFDGILQQTLQKTFALDARLVNRRAKSFLLDARLINLRTKTFGLNGIIKAFAQQKAFALDGILQTVNQQKTFLFNAVLKALAQQKTFQLDGILQKTTQKTFLLDAKLIIASARQFLLDAILKVQPTKTFAIDAILTTDQPPRTGTEAVAFTRGTNAVGVY